MQKRAFGEIEPFSLSVGFMLPHPPYVARREDYERYAGKITLPERPESHEQVHHPYIRRWREYTGIAEVSEAEVRRARAAYWGLVHRVDTMADLGCTARKWIGRKYVDRLHLRSWRYAGRTWPLVEACLLRGIGAGSADRPLAWRDCRGAAL